LQETYATQHVLVPPLAKTESGSASINIEAAFFCDSTPERLQAHWCPTSARRPMPKTFTCVRWTSNSKEDEVYSQFGILTIQWVCQL